jgi:hypothetical protein
MHLLDQTYDVGRKDGSKLRETPRGGRLGRDPHRLRALFRHRRPGAAQGRLTLVKAVCAELGFAPARR